jgi:hypothetical protein
VFVEACPEQQARPGENGLGSMIRELQSNRGVNSCSTYEFWQASASEACLSSDPEGLNRPRVTKTHENAGSLMSSWKMIGFAAEVSFHWNARHYADGFQLQHWRMRS